MKKLLFSLLLIPSFLFSQATPCSGGTAAGYPCEDFGLQSYLSLSQLGASTGNDSWGWTDPMDNSEYALVGLNNGTYFIDITDPVNPRRLGKLPSHNGVSSTWRDIKTYLNHAYIVSEASGHGMQIFDLTQLRGLSTNSSRTFSETAHYGGFGNAHNIVINEDTGYAYPVGTSRTGASAGGPWFLKINPVNPSVVTLEGTYSAVGYSHDAQVITYNGPDTEHVGKEIYIGSNENEIVILDITNKAAPITLSTIGYSNYHYAHQGWFTEDHRYFLLGDELDERDGGGGPTRTIIFDLLDLDTPVEHFQHLGSNSSIDHNGYVKGNRFYLSSYSAGMRVLKVDDIENKNLTEVSHFDTWPSNNNASFNGTWNVYPYFASGNVIISNYNTGFFVIKDENFDNTNPVASCAPYVATLDRVTGSVTIDAADLDNGSTDDFGIVKSTLTGQTTFTCADVGTVFNVTLTVEDDYGNQDSCTTTVTVAGELNTYTAGGWSQGAAPGPGSNAKFSNDYNTASGSITACSCEIDATRTVTVGADDYLDIYGNITVNGDLIVQHTGSVVQTDDAASVIKNGTINVEVTSPILKKRDFMVMGSPMDVETRTGVWNSAFLVLDFHPDLFLPHPDVPAGGTNFADDNGNFYQTYTGTANPGEAYVVRPQSGYNDPTVPPAGRTFDFTYELGTLNNGVVTYTNINNGPTDNPDGTPNMIANPYASAIDADQFMSDNTGINELYYWEHLTAPGTPLPVSNLRYDMDDFSYYNGTMGIPAANDLTMSHVPNGVISTAQGFGVRTTGAAGTTGTITFNNSQRLTSGNTTLRRPQVPAEQLLLEVRELTYNLGAYTGIAFKEGATPAFDSGMDSQRLATIVSLHSHLDDGTEELGIQTRGAFDPAMQIPMGFNTQIDEELSYKISLADIQGVNLEEVDVYLMDHQTGRIQNLKQDSYAFTSNEATDNNRFTLYFEEAIVLGPQENDQNNIILFPNPVKDQLTITSTKSFIQSVEVFDLTARRMNQNIQGKKNSCVIDISKLETAVYFIKITTETGTITKKIIKQNS